MEHPMQGNRRPSLWRLLENKQAIDNRIVTPNNMELQVRFNYWVSQFEAQYGDIVVFFVMLGEMGDNEKITLINNLLIDLIKPEVDENSARSDEEGNGSQP